MVARHSSIALVLAVSLACVVAAGCVSSSPDLDRGFPVLSELASYLPNESAGIAIATVEDGQSALVFLGNPDFDEQTFFEFGSITKVLTGMLLAQAAEEGAVRLEESLNEYLPAEARGDLWRSVTLTDLATHAAGIPPHPDNFGPVRLFFAGRARNPFSGYDREMLVAGVRREGDDRPGDGWEYSNFGYAIIGDVLARSMGASYESLVDDRVFEPIGMTTATLSGWGGDSIAPPLTRRGRPATNWTFRAFAPAGALRGTIVDGMALLEASMLACSTDGPVARANCLAQRTTGVRVNSASEMGLGWVRTERSGATAIWHNGGTGGYSTFLGFSAERDRGIVALSNVGRFREIDARLLDWILEGDT